MDPALDYPQLQLDGMAEGRVDLLIRHLSSYFQSGAWRRMFANQPVEFVVAGRRHYATCLGGGGSVSPTLRIFGAFDDVQHHLNQGINAAGFTQPTLSVGFGGEGENGPPLTKTDRGAVTRILGDDAFDGALPSIIKVARCDLAPLAEADLLVVSAAAAVVSSVLPKLSLRPGLDRWPTFKESRPDDYETRMGELELFEGLVQWRFPASIAGRWGTCNVCNAPTKVRCSRCSALYFCGRRCQRAGHAQHARECADFARDVAFRAADGGVGEAASDPLPMPWARLTCGLCAAHCAVLASSNVHGLGVWRGLCSPQCARASRDAGEDVAPSAALLLPADAGGLAPLARELWPQRALAATSPVAAVRSWAEWHAARGAPIESPAALVLHPALTVYFALVLALQRGTPAVATDDAAADTEQQVGDATGASSPLEAAVHARGGALCVHVIGPEECELDAIGLFAEVGGDGVARKDRLVSPQGVTVVSSSALFAEVAALMPMARLHFELVGPAVGADRDGEEHELLPSTATARLIHGEYSAYAASSRARPAAVAVGLNAGVAAYPTWLLALESLARARTSAVFTDYMRHSCRAGVGLARAAFAGSGAQPLEIQLNPFRSPVERGTNARQVPGGGAKHYLAPMPLPHCCPMFSNGYLYGFVFP